MVNVEFGNNILRSTLIINVLVTGRVLLIVNFIKNSLISKNDKYFDNRGKWDVGNGI
jgi:hypothetical protein